MVIPTNNPPEYYYSEEYLMAHLETIAITGSMKDVEDFTIFVISRLIRLNMEVSQELKSSLSAFNITYESLVKSVNSESTS